MTTNAITSRPIPSVRNKGKIYLQLFRQETQGLPIRLKVIPTELGRQTLNPFWPIWLRQMILRKTRAQEVFTVEIQNKYVMVSGGKTPAGLQATTVGLAAQIRPLPSVLKLDNDAPDHVLRWIIRDKQHCSRVGLMAEALKVPRGVAVSFDSQWSDDHSSMLSVSCHYNDRRSLRELRLNIEMQVALMCE